jgi:hypothetical protein
MTDSEKASVLQVIYNYTERFESVEEIDDLALLDSLLLRYNELSDLIREEDQQYEDTLLLIDLLGEVDGPSGN